MPVSALLPRVKETADWVNNYPRKIHAYKTANEMAA
jgi:IS30 family transposase